MTDSESAAGSEGKGNYDAGGGFLSDNDTDAEMAEFYSILMGEEEMDRGQLQATSSSVLETPTLACKDGGSSMRHHIVGYGTRQEDPLDVSRRGSNDPEDFHVLLAPNDSFKVLYHGRSTRNDPCMDPCMLPSMLSERPCILANASSGNMNHVISLLA